MDAEECYALATASAGVDVWDWRPDTAEIHTRPRSRGLGFERHEATVELDRWIDRVHPEDAPRVRAAVQAVIEGRSRRFEQEVRLVREDGTSRWFLASGTATAEREGRPERVVGTIIDIHERKQRDLKLEDAVHELTRVSSLAMLGEVTASIAHEVNQPIAVVMMNARACLRWLDLPNPPAGELRAAVMDIATAGNRAKEVVHRNQELFRHHTVEQRAVDLNSVVRDVAVIARLRLDRSEVALQTNLDPALPPILGDHVQIQQVLLNLILNGIHAMEAVSPPRVMQVETRCSGESVHLAVRDFGIGLGDVNVEQIFQPFYTRKPGGTGVGLSISRSIVQAHGGTVWAERHGGPGTTFHVTIPVALEGPEAHARTRRSDATRRE
jgi:PAS domain S-box-containing protein